MSLKHIVQNYIVSCLDNTPFNQEFELEMPRYEHGDYALNLAFKLAKTLRKSPNIIATELSTQINSNADAFSVAALSGFVNITLSDNVLSDYFFTFLNEEPCLKVEEPVLLEYVSANPTGPLHIGHGRWAVIGDTLTRLLKRVGVQVDSEFYVNDAGNQVQIFESSVSAIQNGLPVPENGYGGHFIDYIVENNTKDVSPVDFTIAYQKQTLIQLGCSFDTWFKETDLSKGQDILDVIKQHFSRFVYEKDGALWFKTTEFTDDKDRVLMKANGDLTYFASDIVYHLTKLERGYASIVNIWGADHHGYIPRLTSALQAYNSKVSFKVILGQLVNLFKDGEPIKMSKRTGDLIELKEVMDDIGIDATRYFLLEKKPEHSLDFDLSVAKQKSMDNPVYYIQYAHARICKIIDKATELECCESKRQLNAAERKLMLHGAKYYDVLYEAAASNEPYKLPQYVLELAKLFHSFYQTCPVLVDNKVDTLRFKIIGTVQKILQDGCNILGVSTPTQM
jgi:arginyl-tRNA synthetase